VLALVLGLMATPAFAQTAPEVHVVAGTGAMGLALREGPGLQHAMLGVLPEGTSVTILSGPISNGSIDWYEVEIQGAGTMSGYSNGAYLASPDRVVSAGVNPPAGSKVVQAKVTAYANGADGGAVGSRTASGTTTHWGTVAADLRLYPFGTKLLIEGYEGTIFVVEDTGGGVRGEMFDIWFPDLPTAVRFGTQYRQVTVLPSGS
jgi:3D (Asp-Asp-Asp) domain-containing protein